MGAGPKKSAVRLWQGIFGLILLVFVIMLGARLVQTNQSEQRAAGVAPAFSFTTFEGAESISLDQLAGKGVVLNFWASWCDPCRDEAALLEETWRSEQENGIVFIGLGLPRSERRPKLIWPSSGSRIPAGRICRAPPRAAMALKACRKPFLLTRRGTSPIL